ncbi:MAG: nitrilase-related carbon-nitrogen hydrolase, partial [Candidatus Paceibacterota bacterium]
MQKSNNDFGFIRVGAAVPKLKVGNPIFNAEEITRIIDQANKSNVQILLFPELCISGYTSADLFHQKALLAASLRGLKTVMDKTKKAKAAVIVGFPLECGDKIYNVAAFIHAGKIWGLVPKTYIPNYKEFYEQRWFSSANVLRQKSVKIFGRDIPIGKDLLFSARGINNGVFGIEICEDLWVPIPPSSHQTMAGATVIFNPSASNELVGKSSYRRSLVINQSARTFSGYVYASCGTHESSTDVVFGGHAIIAENGSLLNENSRFARES